jgi:hypothetical protein
MTPRVTAFAKKFWPFLLVWLALHAVVLAVLAFGWGLAVVLRAVLGWLFHVAVFLILAVTGIWLAMRLWDVAKSRWPGDQVPAG